MAPTTLVKTNLQLDEMVPDFNTPGHDSRFWCLPPEREDLDAVVPITGGFEFHLVTQGREVGVWRNWMVAQAMVSGYQHAGYKGHHSYTSCVVEWQAHCTLGVHPHPADPQTSKEKVLATHGKARRRSSSTPAPRRSSGVKAAPRGSASRTPRYYAIWGGEVVHSTKYAARSAFEDAVEEGGEPELLSTGDFEVALAYAEGDV
ncbi:hypothetical protein DFH08DRAFT_953112 [Mycena albidolilacea]|uniref:Ribonuclease H1 N-terminal domain-containing protein n=1 Tax=Mycena albidolilacea TaxID=1033008 RepID=A0AAD7AGF8_9AGAR|nr:hypothetical protein DFH08DRAFT_953112 [Mycena albidolilacea]